MNPIRHNVLIAGPHPDDQELGMGGTIVRLAAQGHKVLLLDMTNGEPTPHGSPEQRQREWEAATQVFNDAAAEHAAEKGVRNLFPVERAQLGLKNREVQHTLQARHAAAEVIREHQASILFIPYPQDAHPDHVATTRIMEDARFDAKLTKTALSGEPIYPKWFFYYYCTHLRMVADPVFAIDTTGQMDAKEASIRAYESQFETPAMNRKVVTWVRQMNGYIGSRIGTAYAEPFWAREPLGLGSLDGLVM